MPLEPYNQETDGFSVGENVSSAVLGKRCIASRSVVADFRGKNEGPSESTIYRTARGGSSLLTQPIADCGLTSVSSPVMEESIREQR